jgi:hypothetical protein
MDPVSGPGIPMREALRYPVPPVATTPPQRQEAPLPAWEEGLRAGSGRLTDHCLTLISVVIMSLVVVMTFAAAL